MSAEGFRLVIPQDMLNRLQKADEKLEQLGRTSENTQQKVIASFRAMADGINPFIQKLNEAQQALANIGNNKGGNINLGNVSIQATQAADDVNKLVDVIAKLYAENEKIKNQQLSSRGITIAQEGQLSKKQASTRAKELLNDERELMNAQRERERELMRADKESAKRHALQMARYRQEIQEITRFSRIYAQIPKTLSTKDAGRLIARSVQSDKSINQSLIAIKNLEKAKKDLDTTDRRYAQTLAKINSEIDRHKANLRKLGVETENVRKHQSNLMNHAQQLRRALALVFSVSQITGYVNKMIQIRGEFELQQRSLQAILQNKDEANRIWQQTVDLAVRSPFRVKELVTYTKQLAAYRVETEKLHETTRMLSDVSAGLGVDMQRLILAFGQVKAANYLRGTELRQFSEAGINILGELSKYFTELEGRAISVGEVFERVSKRMVAFSDVEEIFKRITSEGGIFYRMQEIQSETVKGLISNLYDQIDLMFNEIGKSNDGILKGSIGLVKTLVENWEVLAEVLKGAAAAFALYKLNALLANESTMLLAKDMGVLTNASQKQLTVTQLLSVGLKNFERSVNRTIKALKNFVVSNPWVVAITAAIYVTTKLYNTWDEHREQLEEINKQYAEFKSKVSNISVKFNYATSNEERKKELNNLISLAKNDLNIDVNIDLKGLSDEELKERFASLREQIMNTQVFANKFAIALQKATEWTIQDDIVEDFGEFGKAASNLSNILRDQTNGVSNLINHLIETGKLTDELKEKFKARGVNESELEYITRLSEAYDKFFSKYGATTYQVAWGTLGARPIRDDLGEELYKDVEKAAQAIGQFRAKAAEAEKEFKSLVENLNIATYLTEEERKLQIDVAINKTATDKNFDEFQREYLRKLAYQKWEITITPTLAPTELEPWAQRVKEAVEKVNAKIKQKNPNIEDNQLFLVPQIGQTREQYLNLAKARLEIAKATYNAEQQIIDESVIKQTEALAPYADEIEKILNLYKEKTKDGGRDIFADQIRVIKEIYQAYKDLGKTLDDIGAKEGAMLKFGNAFKEAFGKTPKEMGFDLFSEEGVKKAYDYLIKNAPNAKKKIQTELAKGEIVLETKVRLQQEEDKEFADQIADMFSGYELSLELQKLNIPQDLAQQLFGVETFDLSQIREKLEKEIADAEKQGGREDFVAERKKELEKVEEMERKAQEERLKTYSKYLVKGFNERINLKIQELRELEKLEEYKDKFTPQQYQAVKKGIQDEYNTKIQKQEWEEFEKSSQYLNLFDDIENSSNAALRSMLSHLESLKQSMIAAGLPASDLKEILNQIEKVEEELEERTPVATFDKDLGTAVGKIGEYIKARKEEKKLLKDIENLRNKERELSPQVAEEQDNAKNNPLYQTLLAAQKHLATLEEGTQEYEIQEKAVEALYKAVYPVTTEHQEITEQIGETNQELDDAQSKTKKWKEALKGVGNGIVKFGGHLKEVGSFVSDMAQKWEQAFGLSDRAREDMETIANVAQSAGDMAVGIGNAIADPKNIGAYMQAASGLMGVFATFGQAHDKEKERQIEREIKLVERLQKVYEDLGDTIKNAYSIDTLNEATQMSRENIMAQIEATNRMIEAEKGKKDTDWERIEDWKEDIEELKEAMKELEETRLQELGAFASDENKKSGAEAFLDAWMEAYKQTGDGLSGLNEQFDEFFEDMIKKQLLQRASNKYLSEFYEVFDRNIRNWADNEISGEDAINNILKAKDEYMPQLNEWLKRFADSLGVAEDLAGSTAELSGLQAGIQGITEDQADVLASYMNSVRFYVADNNDKFTDLITRLFDSEGGSNPMLAELRAQTAFIREIRDSLGGVIRGGHSMGGAGLKVFVS